MERTLLGAKSKGVLTLGDLYHARARLLGDLIPIGRKPQAVEVHQLGCVEIPKASISP